MAPMTAAVMNAVGPQRAGLGSAMTNTSREVGGVVGIALLGTILTTGLKGAFTPALAGLGLPAGQQAAIAAAAGHGTLDPTLLHALGLSPAQSGAVLQAFGDAFMSGFHTALIVGGCVVLAAAIVANRFIPSGAPRREVEVGVHEPEPVAVEL
jgi:hypothetical protein